MDQTLCWAPYMYACGCCVSVPLAGEFKGEFFPSLVVPCHAAELERRSPPHREIATHAQARRQRHARPASTLHATSSLSAPRTRAWPYQTSPGRDPPERPTM